MINCELTILADLNFFISWLYNFPNLLWHKKDLFSFKARLGDISDLYFEKKNTEFFLEVAMEWEVED